MIMTQYLDSVGQKNICCRYIKSLSFKFPKETIQKSQMHFEDCEAIEMSVLQLSPVELFILFFLIYQNLVTF